MNKEIKDKYLPKLHILMGKLDSAGINSHEIYELLNLICDDDLMVISKSSLRDYLQVDTYDNPITISQKLVMHFKSGVNISPITAVICDYATKELTREFFNNFEKTIQNGRDVIIGD